MSLPFTADEFFGTFRTYNETVHPAQWALVGLALGTVALATRGGRTASRLAAAGLALLWLWTGAVYHLVFFRPVNPAATVFGAFFVAQAGLLAWAGVLRSRLAFRARSDAAGTAGVGLMAYALVVYPLVGYALGHRYPATPTFGLPCPTTIFTLGLLLWTSGPVPWRLLVIPVLWALIASQAVFAFGVWQDLGLLAAAAIAPAVLWRRERPRPAEPRARLA